VYVLIGTRKAGHGQKTLNEDIVVYVRLFLLMVLVVRLDLTQVSPATACHRHLPARNLLFTRR